MKHYKFKVEKLLGKFLILLISLFTAGLSRGEQPFFIYNMAPNAKNLNYHISNGNFLKANDLEIFFRHIKQKYSIDDLQDREMLNIITSDDIKEYQKKHTEIVESEGISPNCFC